MGTAHNCCYDTRISLKWRRHGNIFHDTPHPGGLAWSCAMRGLLQGERTRMQSL